MAAKKRGSPTAANVPNSEARGLERPLFDILLPSMKAAEAAKLLPSEIRDALLGGSTVWQLSQKISAQRDAVQLAYLFHKRPSAFKAWFEKWKEAPDYGFLCRLVDASNIEGVLRFQEANAAKAHKNHRSASERIPVLWSEKKAAGMDKNKAAPEIAKQVNLALSTVRKKLQGLP